MRFYDVLCQWSKETEIVIKCCKLSWPCRKLSWHFFSRPLPAVPFWLSPILGLRTFFWCLYRKKVPPSPFGYRRFSVLEHSFGAFIEKRCRHSCLPESCGQSSTSEDQGKGGVERFRGYGLTGSNGQDVVPPFLSKKNRVFFLSKSSKTLFYSVSRKMGGGHFFFKKAMLQRGQT